MLRPRFIIPLVAGAALASLTLLAQSPAAQGPVQGEWTASIEEGKAHLQLQLDDRGRRDEKGRSRGNWTFGRSFPVSELAGLPAGQPEHLSTENARFELNREAGTLKFQGSFRDGRGAGHGQEGAARLPDDGGPRLLHRLRQVPLRLPRGSGVDGR
jgi:hypothetical protein